MSLNDPETLTWIRECYLSQRIRAISTVPTSNSEHWKIKVASGLQAVLKVQYRPLLCDLQLEGLLQPLRSKTLGVN